MDLSPAVPQPFRLEGVGALPAGARESWMPVAIAKDPGDLVCPIRAPLIQRFRPHWLVWEYLSNDYEARCWYSASAGALASHRAAQSAFEDYLTAFPIDWAAFAQRNGLHP